MSNEPINIFDFDGTLTNETWPKFWVWVKKFGYSGEARNSDLEKAINEYKETHEGNNLEKFFGFFNDLLKDNNETISQEELMEGEKYIVYNPGAEEFIKNSKVKNYIVSGGLKEFLEGLQIAKYSSGIYGTPILYNENGDITGIGEVMTDDKKLLAIKDILRINGREENDCKNVCYIGDGSTDAEAMKFVHNNGGIAIFVHQSHTNDKYYEQNKQIYETLNANGQVDYCFIADYNSEGELVKVLNRK